MGTIGAAHFTASIILCLGVSPAPSLPLFFFFLPQSLFGHTFGSSTSMSLVSEHCSFPALWSMSCPVGLLVWSSLSQFLIKLYKLHTPPRFGWSCWQQRVSPPSPQSSELLSLLLTTRFTNHTGDVWFHLDKKEVHTIILTFSTDLC